MENKSLSAHLGAFDSQTNSAPASPTAAAETLAKDAAGKVTVAKERLDKLANGETITGGIGEPLTREWAKKILLDDGWTAAEIRLAFGLAKLSEAEFDVFVDMGVVAIGAFTIRGREQRTSLYLVVPSVG